ncbi:MAG TPA: DUF2884 family protein [Arenimonas sp.]|nr:DUF2884 family protein [Arenimonas sp.]
MQKQKIRTISILSSAIFLACAASTQAHEINMDVSCNASSDYNISLNGQAFIFEGQQKRTPRVVLGGGKLFVNGKQVQLTIDDQKRIDTFESEMRLLVPESQKIVIEAVNIAYDALSMASASISNNPEKVLAQYQAERKVTLKELQNSKTVFMFNDDAMDAIIEPIVAKFVPTIAGNAVGFAFRAMFAGEAKANEMEARMDAMGDNLDKQIEARADALEPLAEAMCKRIQKMDAIENALTVRLPNGKPINFLDVINKQDLTAQR